jgi:hypothetical protein
LVVVVEEVFVEAALKTGVGGKIAGIGGTGGTLLEPAKSVDVTVDDERLCEDLFIGEIGSIVSFWKLCLIEADRVRVDEEGVDVALVVLFILPAYPPREEGIGNYEYFSV